MIDNDAFEAAQSGASAANGGGCNQLQMPMLAGNRTNNSSSSSSSFAHQQQYFHHHQQQQLRNNGFNNNNGGLNTVHNMDLISQQQPMIDPNNVSPNDYELGFSNNNGNTMVLNDASNRLPQHPSPLRPLTTINVPANSSNHQLQLGTMARPKTNGSKTRSTSSIVTGDYLTRRQHAVKKAAAAKAAKAAENEADEDYDDTDDTDDVETTDDNNKNDNDDTSDIDDDDDELPTTKKDLLAKLKATLKTCKQLRKQSSALQTGIASGNLKVALNKQMVEKITFAVERNLWHILKFTDSRAVKIKAYNYVYNVVFAKDKKKLGDSSYRKNWIATYKGTIIKAMNTHRNYLQGRAKNSIKPYYKETKKVPSNDDIKKCVMRNINVDNKEDFALFEWYWFTHCCTFPPNLPSTIDLVLPISHLCLLSLSLFLPSLYDEG